MILSFFISILFFIKNPFTYKGYYNLTNFEFSHVIFSRFISPLILYSYYKILISDNIKKVFYFSFTAFILTITLIYTSHRATTIGLILSLIILLILSKQKLTHNNLIIFTGVLIVSLLVVTKFNLIEKRNYELIDFVLSNKTTDASINTRLELYKISFELIKKNPVTGIGFGGFKSYYKSDLPMKLKYPHNLFLETQVELGIIGSILLFALIYLILKNTIKYSRLIFVFALFSLWLSLFSKDLTTQNLLFINIIFINNRNHNHN
ncbi:O-antigen ligase family protein [Rosettibacter firmus]|uniref:O-antigen ligase family protein n=1 Tax=Rosettibacter firmus TaxID=3111522 RepID=UPI00336BBA3D